MKKQTPAHRKPPPGIRRVPRPGVPLRIPNAARHAATRAALLEAGRDLFGGRGFSAVTTEEIVHAAGVTRGAMYHHFNSKRDLFQAVFDEVEGEMVAHVGGAVTNAAADGDLWHVNRVGVAAFLEFCADPAVERISILDAPSVLDATVRRKIALEHGGMLVRATLNAMIADGLIKPQPVDLLAELLIGALVEGATAVANAEQPAQARDEVVGLIDKMMRGVG